MDFGKALQALKEGEAVARAGWNGKGMFLFLNKGSRDTSMTLASPYVEGIDHRLFEAGDNGTITRLPNINMRAATGSTVTGWLASQTDMLAEDWEIIRSGTVGNESREELPEQPDAKPQD